MTLTDQEIEELRIEIAECVGWQQLKQGGWRRPNGTIENTYYGESWRLPPYTTSIDSIREAAMERFECPLDQYKFQYDLDSVYNEQNHYQEWKLTALDWSIAFARTAKIWRYQ